MSMNRYFVVLIVALSIVTVPVVGSAMPASGETATVSQTTTFAQTNESQPDSASAYLATFRGLNGTAAYTTYSEFEVIRSQAVLAVQIGNFTETEAERMRLVLNLLQTFQTAYGRQQAGEYGAAIEAANDTSKISQQLRAVEGGERYAVLAEVALERFYARTGQALQSAAESESVTRERIETLRRAALAYQRAGATDRYSQVLIRVESSEQSYRADVSSMNESAAAASSFVNGCSNCGGLVTALTGYGFGVFPKYRAAQEATRETDGALALAEQHGLSARAQALADLRSSVEDTRSTLALASATLIVGYTVILGLFCSLIAWRLVVWQRDLEAAAHGDSVLVGAMLRG
ncbi:hypothetical protein EGH21_19590 [Halomicroarcula sp. F13]|uniref:Uncharacterized protein n=1 Tax=Haloarcula rubra TaxID=2487747 RepID=A0AAW4PW14_9EURY|nr:hypothetical protein [Halomicroarcula rubra]MBX0325233.1 hypothetical protein [Halomicroarcula rubra]